MNELLIAIFRFFNPWLTYFEAKPVDMEVLNDDDSLP